MEKIGTFDFITESYLLDFRGRLPLPMIGNYLLHCAGEHARQKGFGFNDMSERSCAWVLSRIAIEMSHYPTMSEPITIQTWVEDVGRLFTNRCFALADKDGRNIGYARSIWAAIDMETRKPSDLTGLGNLKEYVTDAPCPIDKPGKIVAAETDTEGELYRVRYSDLDVNGHFNSIKYIEHLLNLFDIEMFREEEISRIEISYVAEGRYGMELSLHKKEITPGRYAASICGPDGKALCRAAVTWR